MLPKTPQNPVDQPEAALAGKLLGFRVRKGRVNINQQLIVALAILAKIPSSKAKDFDIFDVLTNWLQFASGKINQPAELEVLNNLIHAANELHRMLKCLEDELSRRISTGKLRSQSQRQQSWTIREVRELLSPLKKEDLLFKIRAGLQMLPVTHGLDCSVDIPGLQDRLAVLIKVAKDLRKSATGVERGAPVGVRDYPGLRWLVISLELKARALGGRFTLNKKDRKGSLLDALDLLRECLAACPDLKFLADLIPMPNKHPVASYARALIRARQRRFGRWRWSRLHKLDRGGRVLFRSKIHPPIMGAS